MNSYEELRAEYEQSEKRLVDLKAKYDKTRERNKVLRQRNTNGLLALAVFMFCSPFILIILIYVLEELT